jgi:hypothetical protein
MIPWDVRVTALAPGEINAPWQVRIQILDDTLKPGRSQAFGLRAGLR